MNVSRKALLPLMIGALAVLLPASASASTMLGSNTATGACVGGTWTYVQPVSPVSTSYTAAGGGVITSWSFQATAQAPTLMKLRVLRPTNTADTFTTVALSPPQSPAINQLSTFPARIAVQPGDFLGYTATTGGAFPCGGGAVAGFGADFLNSDPAAGSTDTYQLIGSPYEINISAQLEADADGDGFGDETQDLCPTDPSTHGACPDRTAPDTEITKHPKAKTKKRRATFEFRASELGSGFECSLDGSGFKACVSPVIKTVSKGKHSFQVRAVDAAGNRDQTPAKASWKVKKRKHRGGHK